MAIVAETSTLKNLENLGLAATEIGDAGAIALGESKILGNLRKLHLNKKDKIYIKGAKALSKLVDCNVNINNSSLLILEKEVNKISNISSEKVKNEIFSVAQADNIGKSLRYIIEDFDRYHFTINSRDKNGNTLEHFYNNKPKMKKFLFEHGLLPKPEQLAQGQTMGIA